MPHQYEIAKPDAEGKTKAVEDEKSRPFADTALGKVAIAAGSTAAVVGVIEAVKYGLKDKTKTAAQSLFGGGGGKSFGF